VVVLSDLEGLPYAEVAEALGIPLGTVKSRIFRARRILQGQLRRYAEESGLIRPTEPTP
jgi:RNA polymerase sigma-70 factor (ECF subfamily)